MFRTTLRLPCRTVAITGGARGIGMALAFAVAEAGGQVAILDAASKPHENHNLLEEITETSYSSKVNVTDYDGLSKAFERMNSDFGERPWQDVKRCFGINVLGTYYAAQLAARYMAKTSSNQDTKSVAPSSIVMIRSVAAHRASVGQFASDYCSSKGAVLSLTKELEVKIAEQKIRANCIFGRTSSSIAKRHPELAALLQSEPPMKLMGDRLNLKGAAVYLLSEASAYMKGGEILVSGGIYAGRIN
ncbi:hypothetical protein BDV06DRAFT_231060 [Aspergillus oleicola]